MIRRPLPLKLAVVSILLTFAAGASSARAFASPRTSEGEPDAFSISIAKPAEDDISDNDLSIAATVGSTFELSSVKAQVDGREVGLTFSNTAVCGDSGSCGPGWGGVLSLAGLTRGAKTLTITATDVFGKTGQAQRHFKYDQPPRVTATSLIA